MFLKKLLSHSLIYAFGPQIPKLASIFVLPVITRYLTMADYGVYGVITSYVGILAALADLGFSVVLVNSYYQYPNRWMIVWRQLHFYLLAWSVIYAFILALLMYVFMPANASQHTLSIILLVAIPSSLLNPTIIIGSRYYQFARKPLFVALTSAIVGVVAILLNLYTIAGLKMGYMGWFVSTFVSTLLQFIFFLYPVYFKYKLAPIFIFRKSFLIKNLKVSLPVIPHSYSSYLLNSSDRIVMDRVHVPFGDIGKYNLAYTIGNYFDFFGNAIGMAIGPVYTSLFSKKNIEKSKQVYFLTHWLQVFFLLTGFLISLWCKEIFDLLIKNAELKTVYPLAIIIIMSYVYRPYYWTAITRLQYSEKTAQLWKISFIAGVINLVLNILLVPYFGVMAAAATTFFAMLYMGFSGFFLKSFKKEEIFKYHPISVIFVIIVLTAIVYALRDVSVVIKIFITIGLSLLYLWYTWYSRAVFKTIEM